MNKSDAMIEKVEQIKALAEQLVSQQREQAERLQRIEQWIACVEAPRVAE